MPEQLLVQFDKALHQAALTAQGPEEKAKAAWEVFRRLNIDTVISRQREVLDELGIAYGGRTTSAVEILDFANKAAYEVHLSLVQHGYSYQALKEAYACDDDTCARLFEIGLKTRGKIFDQIAGIAESMQTSPERSTEALLRRGLEIWGEFYPASHIVTQYSKEHEIEEPRLT